MHGVTSVLSATCGKGLRGSREASMASSSAFGPVLRPHVGRRRHELDLLGLLGDDIDARLARRVLLHRGQSRSVASHAKRSSNARPSPSPDAAPYQAWAKAAGIVFDKVTQAVFPPSDIRGMMALDTIVPGEFFVTLPRQAALVVDPLEKCPIPEFVDPKYYKSCVWYVKMGLLMLAERQRGAESRVRGYIDQLPESIDTPVRWSASELDELQSETLKAAVERQQVEWKRLYDELQRDGGVPTSRVAYDDFVWALENVRSRSFSGPYAGTPIKDRLVMGGLLAAVGLGYAFVAKIPTESVLNAAISVACFNLLYDVVLSSRLKWYAMCPIIDSLNHSGRVSSNIEYEYFKDTFVVSTESAYAEGDQVFISYGAKSNEQLVQYYGFVLEDNPHDACVVDAEVGGEVVRLAIMPNGQLTAETMAMLEENGALRAGVKAGGGKFSEAVNVGIYEAAKKALASKGTSLADDVRLLEAPGMIRGARQRLALEFRVSQKKLLERAIEVAEKRRGGGAGP